MFDDLGDGVPYAIATIDAPRYGHDRIDLGPQAVADIEAARGGTFTIGLRVTSLDGGPLEELVQGGALRLVLESR